MGRKKSERTRDRARELSTAQCPWEDASGKMQDREEEAVKGGNREAWYPQTHIKKEEGVSKQVKSY